MDTALLIHTPLYVLTATTTCHKCRAMQTVTALSCHNLNDGEQDVAPLGDMSELLLLTEVTNAPPQVLEEITRRNPRYVLRYSSTAEMEYYANTCACGALFGDFYLYCEPGGAFFPEEVEAACAITIEELQIEGPLPIECSYSMGSTGQVILEHGKRIESTGLQD